MDADARALMRWLQLEVDRLGQQTQHPFHDLRVHLGPSIYEQGILISRHAGKMVNQMFMMTSDHTAWVMPYFLDDQFERHYAPWMRKTVIHPDPPTFRIAHLDGNGRLRRIHTWQSRMEKAGVPTAFIEERAPEVEAFIETCKDDGRLC